MSHVPSSLSGSISGQATHSLKGDRVTACQRQLQCLLDSVRAYHLCRDGAQSLAMTATIKGVVAAVADLPARDAARLLDDIAGAHAALRTLPGWQAGEFLDPNAPVPSTALLSRLLQGPAWRDENVPLLRDVPEAYWGVYAGWVFGVPAIVLSAEERSLFGCHLLRHLEELLTWVRRNSGSGAVRRAMESYLSGAASLPAVLAREVGLVGAELRGRILTSYFVRGADAKVQSTNAAREGRPLRIGFIQEHFGPCPATYATLACIEQLDTAQFEVVLFAVRQSDSEEAVRCGRKAKHFIILGAHTKGRLQEVRSMNLDVLFFNEPTGCNWSAVTEIALHRVAGLQVANDHWGVSSGLPEMDIYLVGDGAPDEVAAHFSERIGTLRGAVEAYNLPSLALDGEQSAPTREALGLPADGLLLTTVVYAGESTIECVERWADLLHSCAEARLVVACVQRGDATEAIELCAGVDAALQRKGVSSERLIVCPLATAVTEVRSLFRVSDLYLDAGDANGLYWAQEALVTALPVMSVADGNPLGGRVPALLRSLGLGGLVVGSAEYASAVVDFCRIPGRRSDAVDHLKLCLETGIGGFDTLALADAVAAFAETGYDELSALGSDAFRAERTPVGAFVVPSPADSLAGAQSALDAGDVDGAAFEARLVLRGHPSDAQVRTFWGTVLLAQGRSTRAVDYLLPTVQQSNGDPEVWFLLARALRADHRMQEALQALEGCLRLDPHHVEALLLMHQLADAAGANEMAQETIAVLEEAAPGDPRVVALKSQL